MTLIFVNATGILFEDRQLAQILGYSGAVCTVGFSHLSLWRQALLAGLFSILYINIKIRLKFPFFF